MAGYGYTYRGYSTYNGLASQSDNWSKQSYSSDHVCKPVIIDAEGRKQPVVSYTPDCNTGTCITETQTVVQQVHSPFMSDYKHSSPTRYEVEPLKGYGYGEDKWRNPSSPVQHDRPQKVEEFITMVQTEASRPNRFSPLNASHWRQTPNATGFHGSDYNDFDNKQWQKPSGNTIRDESYDDYYRNKNGTQPTMVTNGGWARPSRAGWASPPDTSLSRPTNDIGTAVEFLKEAIKPTSFTTSPHSRVNVPISTGPKGENYAETFDSREGARRYGNFNSSSNPVDTYTSTTESREAAKRYGNYNSSSQPVDTYTPTIDSREAVKRYGNFNSSSQPVDTYAPTIDSREALRKYNGRAI